MQIPSINWQQIDFDFLCLIDQRAAKIEALHPRLIIIFNLASLTGLFCYMLLPLVASLPACYTYRLLLPHHHESSVVCD